MLLEERFTPGQPVQTLWPLADHLGTARVILDGAGLVLSRLTYDSFGNLVNVPAIVPTFTFTGRDYDDASGCPIAPQRMPGNRARRMVLPICCCVVFAISFFIICT